MYTTIVAQSRESGSFFTPRKYSNCGIIWRYSIQSVSICKHTRERNAMISMLQLWGITDRAEASNDSFKGPIIRTWLSWWLKEILDITKVYQK